MITKGLLEITAILALFAAVLVAVQFTACLVAALRRRHHVTSALSVLGLLTQFAALAAVVTAWFAYAVAHTGKDAGTDLEVFLWTIPPYFLVSAALWFAGRRLRARR